MNYAQEVTRRYAAFYRPRLKKGKASSNGATKPLQIAARYLLHNDFLRLSEEELKDVIAAEISKLMAQIHHNTAEGYWMLQGENEREAIEEFARFFYDDFFKVGCYGRRDLLSGNKFRAFIHTCEFIIAGEEFKHRPSRSNSTE